MPGMTEGVAMGEAKRRGTFQERMAAAVARRKWHRRALAYLQRRKPSPKHTKAMEAVAAVWTCQQCGEQIADDDVLPYGDGDFCHVVAVAGRGGEPEPAPCGPVITGRLARNAAGTPVDGGGHGTMQQAENQARAINGALNRKRKT